MGASMSANAFPVEGKTVLITGAPRGIGLEAGRQLTAKGANVIIAARDEKKLAEGVEYISAGSISKWNSGSPPDTVWCCAGASHPTLFVDTDVSNFQSLMNWNYFSSVYIVHATLRAWLRPEKEACGDELPLAEWLTPRQLIFTASFLALYPIAGHTPYDPSKAALQILSDQLSQEMNLYASGNPNTRPVKVHTIFPATIFTDSYEAENIIKSDLTKMLEADGGQTLDRTGGPG